MTSTRDAALNYTASGWPVLALYRAEGPGCTCGAANCKSPGKHPRTDLCPNGVKDATLDPRVIVGWPEDINIGVALGKVAGGAMAFDVDAPVIARALLHPNLGLSDQTGVVSTGRPGAHVWFICKGPTATFHLRAADGTRIGEVRGDGSYVVVPPSLSYTGRFYKWAGRRPGDPPPQLAVTHDPLAYATELLAGVGVAVADLNAPNPASLWDDTRGMVAEAPIPEALKTHGEVTRFRQVLQGHLVVNVTDRSGELYALARSVVKAARDRAYDLTTLELAGVLRTYDTHAFAEPKYAGRASADGAYWDLAAKVLAMVPGDNGSGPAPAPATPTPDTDQPPADGPDSPADQPPPVTPAPASDYFWDEDDGRLYQRGQRQTRPIANFKPEILEEVEVYRGYGADSKREWHLQFTLKGGRSTSFMIAAEDTTQTKLEAEIAKHCSADYIVNTGCYGHLKTALGQLAMAGGGTTGNRVYGTTGWVEHGERWLYLLPASAGAITTDGLEPSVRIDRHKLGEDLRQLFENVARYGDGVRPPLTDSEHGLAWEAFVALLSAGPMEKTLPIVMQVLAGPLASAGLDEALPLVHVLGKTGTLKTTYCLAALGLFGRFTSVPPASWTSTTAWLQLMLHNCKDLTLLVDDFKQIRARRDVYDLLQNYADKTTRGRSTTRQTAQASLRPRGLLLSNGEDVWEDEAATVARTIVVDLMRGDIDTERMDGVQGLIKAGHLQLFGGAYLAWLAGQPQILDGQYLPREQDRWQRVLRRRAGEGVHLRLLATIASLLACTSVVVQFVRAAYGDDCAQWLMRVVSGCLPHLLGKMDEQALQVANLAPWEQIVSALADGMIAREVTLWPRNGLVAGARRMPDAPRADVGGVYYKDDTGEPVVLVTKGLTYTWLKRRLRRQGEDVRFSWEAVVQDAKGRGYRYKQGEWITWEDGQRFQRNGVLVPLAAIRPQTNGAPAESV